MLSSKLVNRAEVLNFARTKVRIYCTIHHIPLIPTIYGIVPSNAKAAFYYHPPKIILWSGISKWLEQYEVPQIRVWALHSCIGHELAHYIQYLDIIKKGAPIRLRELENEAQLSGRQYADDIVSEYTVEEINPLLETIGTAALTGVGLGVGFKAVNWGTSKLLGKNPVPWSKNKSRVKLSREGPRQIKVVTAKGLPPLQSKLGEKLLHPGRFYNPKGPYYCYTCRRTHKPGSEIYRLHLGSPRHFILPSLLVERHWTTEERSGI